jgi:hypothetical protein
LQVPAVVNSKMIDVSLIAEFAKQGAGFLVAFVMFVVWWRDRKDIEKRLSGIIQERKNDRDQLLTLMGRIDGHLQRADAFEKFAREAIKQGELPGAKRRLLDRELADAMAKVESLKELEKEQKET